MGGMVVSVKVSFPQARHTAAVLQPFCSPQPLFLLHMDGTSRFTKTAPTNLEYFIIQTVHGKCKHCYVRKCSAHENILYSIFLSYVLNSPPPTMLSICHMWLSASSVTKKGTESQNFTRYSRSVTNMC